MTRWNPSETGREPRTVGPGLHHGRRRKALDCGQRVPLDVGRPYTVADAARPSDGSPPAREAIWTAGRQPSRPPRGSRRGCPTCSPPRASPPRAVRTVGATQFFCVVVLSFVQTISSHVTQPRATRSHTSHDTHVRSGTIRRERSEGLVELEALLQQLRHPVSHVLVVGAHHRSRRCL